MSVLFAGWPAPTGAEMAALDRDAIERVGISSAELMETAGRAVADAIAARWPKVRQPLVVCGIGNNGGDGFVIARALAEDLPACRPIVVVFGDPAHMSPETAANLAALAPLALSPERDPATERLAALAERCDVIVDAMFGVGLSRAVEGPLAEALATLAASGRPVCAVDLPSGSSADTGETLGVELAATLIVTLGLPKLGLALRPRDAEILVADIGLPEASLARAEIGQRVLSRALAARLLPARPLDGHKGTFGHVFIAGGSTGKTGAVALAALGALRTGAGLVTAAAPASLHAVLEIKLTEAMTLPLDDADRGFLSEAVVPGILDAASSRDAVAIGMGLGSEPPTVDAVRAVLAQIRAPTVVDADALNAFAGQPEALAGAGPRVLTPHPGEAARLLGVTAAEVQAARVASARSLAERTGAVVVLKGARSLIAEPTGALWVNATGGPGLAAGGSGDVLAGVIVALLGQGLAPLDAARLGVYLHGAAGDAGPRVGGLASEVAARIPEVWEALLGAKEPADVLTGRPGHLLDFP